MYNSVCNRQLLYVTTLYVPGSTSGILIYLGPTGSVWLLRLSNTRHWDVALDLLDHYLWRMPAAMLQGHSVSPREVILSPKARTNVPTMWGSHLGCGSLTSSEEFKWLQPHKCWLWPHRGIWAETFCVISTYSSAYSSNVTSSGKPCLTPHKVWFLVIFSNSTQSLFVIVPITVCHSTSLLYILSWCL